MLLLTTQPSLNVNRIARQLALSPDYRLNDLLNVSSFSFSLLLFLGRLILHLLLMLPDLSTRLSYKIQIRSRLANLSLHRSLKPLFQLGHKENGRGESDKEHKIPNGERFRLEHHLQRWEINDHQLAN